MGMIISPNSRRQRAAHRDKASRACRGEHAGNWVLEFLTPNESVWFPEHLGGSEMVFLEVLKGNLCL